MVNLARINNSLLEKFPQIAQINLKRKFPDTLIIEIKERTAAAIFEQNDGYFFIDKEGVIFEKVFEVKPEMLTIESLIQEKDLRLGQKVIDNNLMAKILEIKNELENLEISLKKASLISEQRLNIKTSDNWQIYFNPKNNIFQQISNLKVILRKKILPEKWQDLEYIDLRFEEKIFYKFL
ncbi:MAG: Cell division protein FtsQ [candidate division WS2 bacterium]|nr:Cell division protein FtsQ [Candidatus Psychracetigena formicireducens]